MKKIELVTEVVENDKGEQELVKETYHYPIFVKGSLVKRAIKLGVELEKSTEAIDEDIIDKLAKFAVELYGNRFTVEELIDGIDASELVDTLVSILSSVMGGGEDTTQKKFIEEKMS